MDIKQLRALLAIAETGSVTKASELLNVVQPAVSRQLRLLEKDVGTTLFERQRHGMELTEAGRILAEYARRVLRELDRARTEIQPSSGVVRGAVAIGLLPSARSLLAVPLVARISSLYPDITVRISTGYAGHLEDWLKSGDLDATLLYDPKPAQDLQVQELLKEKLCLVGPPTAAFRGRRSVPLVELADKPLALPSAPHGLRSLVEHACSVAGVRLKVFAETNDMNIQKSLALSGLALTVLPSIAVADDAAAGLLTAVPLTEPELNRRIVLVRPTNRPASAAVEAVVASLVETMKESVRRKNWPTARWLGS